MTFARFFQTHCIKKKNKTPKNQTKKYLEATIFGHSVSCLFLAWAYLFVHIFKKIPINLFIVSSKSPTEKYRKR